MDQVPLFLKLFNNNINKQREILKKFFLWSFKTFAMIMNKTKIKYKLMYITQPK